MPAHIFISVFFLLVAAKIIQIGTLLCAVRDKHISYRILLKVRLGGEQLIIDIANSTLQM